MLARGRTRELIKFDPLDPYALSDSDDDEDLKKAVPAFVRSPTRTDSMATLTNEGPSPVKGTSGRRVRIDTLSDDEEDVTSGVAREQTAASNGENWSPDFIRRHSQRQLGHKQSVAGFSQAASSHGSSATLAPATFVPLPATPSLIKAVERVNAAQHQAFASQAARSTDGLPMPSPLAGAGPTPPQGHAQGRHWDSFWHEVKTKAGHGFHHRQDIGGGIGNDSGSGSKR